MLIKKSSSINLILISVISLIVASLALMLLGTKPVQASNHLSYTLTGSRTSGSTCEGLILTGPAGSNFDDANQTYFCLDDYLNDKRGNSTQQRKLEDCDEAKQDRNGNSIENQYYIFFENNSGSDTGNRVIVAKDASGGVGQTGEGEDWKANCHRGINTDKAGHTISVVDKTQYIFNGGDLDSSTDSCSGMTVFGPGGDGGKGFLHQPDQTYQCLDDIDNSPATISTDQFDDTQCTQIREGSSTYFIFVENKSSHTGNRLLIRKTDLRNLSQGTTSVDGIVQDWSHNCGSGKDGDEATLSISVQASFDDEDPSKVILEGTSVAGAGTTLSQGNSDACSFKLSSLGLGWIVCMLLEAVDELINFLVGTSYKLLNIEETAYLQENYQNLWRAIRDLMTYAILATALIMVISTALDFGVFKNYTVKKYLPRLIIGTIAIQLSWGLGEFFIQFMNQIGDVIGALVFSVSPDAEDHGLAKIAGAGSESLLIGLAGGTAAYIAGALAFLPIAFTLIAGLVIAFLFLMARKFLIIFLLVLAPLGITFWLFPGNDKAWRIYFRTFFYLLLLYPALVLLISIAKVFSHTVAGGNGLDKFFAFVIYVGAFAVIPLIAKMFTGVLGQITGRINDKSKGLIDRPRKAMKQLATDRRKAIKENRLKQSQFRIATGDATRMDALRARGKNIRKGGSFFNTPDAVKQSQQQRKDRRKQQRAEWMTENDPANRTTGYELDDGSFQPELPFNQSRWDRLKDSKVGRRARYQAQQTRQGLSSTQADRRERQQVSAQNLEHEIFKAAEEYGNNDILKGAVKRQTNSNPKQIAELITNENTPTNIRSAAVGLLSEFKASSQMRDVLKYSAQNNNPPYIVQALQSQKHKFFDAFNELAPDLARFGFDNATNLPSSGVLTVEQQRTLTGPTLTAQSASKFSYDTWQNLTQQITDAQARPKLETVIKQIQNSPRLYSDLSPDAQQLLKQFMASNSNNNPNQPNLPFPQ